MHAVEYLQYQSYFYYYHSPKKTENWKTIISALKQVPGKTESYHNLAKTSYRFYSSHKSIINGEKWTEKDWITTINLSQLKIIAHFQKINILIVTKEKIFTINTSSKYTIILYQSPIHNIYQVGLLHPQKSIINVFQKIPNDIANQILANSKKTRKKIIPKKN